MAEETGGGDVEEEEDEDEEDEEEEEGKGARIDAEDRSRNCSPSYVG